MTRKHILIVGTGSVGKRHAQNLNCLGCLISCVDPREDRLEEARNQTPIKETYTSFSESLEKEKKLSGVVIASPTSFHVEQAIVALEKGLPVLLEKPLSTNFEKGEQLRKVVEKTGGSLLLGYTWRWWPPLVKVKQLMSEGIVGKVYHVKFVMSAHLADWHPWENYQEFFMASKELGGGALLEESHWLDLMVWFFGMPEKLFARVDKISSLEIETDDNVDMLVFYKNDMIVSLHLDLYGRPHEKSITFSGEDGTLIWNENQISIGKKLEPQWATETFKFERNDMFMNVGKEYLDVLDGKPVRTCTLDDGIKVLSLIEAVRKSSLEGKMVELS